MSEAHQQSQKPQYKFRSKWSVTPNEVSAQVVGEELERIRIEREGRLHAADVVEEAKPKTAPLHPAFEWRDGVAAASWREHQARNLIRSVVEVYTDSNGKTSDVPAFVSVQTSDPDPESESGKTVTVSYYQSTAVAVTQPNEWRLAVTTLAQRVHAAQHAVTSLQSYADAAGSDNAAMIGLAAQALATAGDAIRRLSVQ